MFDTETQRSWDAYAKVDKNKRCMMIVLQSDHKMCKIIMVAQVSK